MTFRDNALLAHGRPSPRLMVILRKYGCLCVRLGPSSSKRLDRRGRRYLVPKEVREVCQVELAR